ncbi:MAG: YraN family protein [Bacteroides sp.]|nr:YraN family protein [Bacteroides sp.]
MAQHNEIGKWGEDVAREYLITKGYAIANSNQRIGHKEIDIIAIKDNRIVFVEVKTRSTDFVDPAEAVDAKKISRIARAADRYIQSYDIKHEPQFDIITVVGTPETGHTLTHYEDAFLPPLSGAW